jgi:hypothetical protein
MLESARKKRQAWSVVSAVTRLMRVTTGALLPALKGTHERDGVEKFAQAKTRTVLRPSHENAVVVGGGVWVPLGRIGEVPKVIQEQREREAERARLLLFARR